MSNDIKLEEAIKICLAHGLLPLPKESIESITSAYDLVEAAMDGIINLQPVFSAIAQGLSVSVETAQRNYNAIEKIKQFAEEKKPQYATVKMVLNKLLEQNNMTIIGPLDHDAIFESDVSNVFLALGVGYEIWLINVTKGQTLWCIPPTNQYAQFYMDVESINPLIDNGLAMRIDVKDLPVEKRERIYHSTDAIFCISEKGKNLYSEIEAQASNAENKDMAMQQIFRTKLSIKRYR